MAMVLYVPDKPDNPKLPILGKEFEYFPKLVVQMWCKCGAICWMSVGICSLRAHIPSSAGHHRQMRRSALSALSLLFHTASALEQARLAGYKTTTPDFRQAPHLS